ncbi:MAG: sodium:solute symporter, partial [Bacteroidota bacterium]
MGTFELSTVDLIVMAVYAVFIIGYGLYSAKAQSSEEYFLAGRNMTWPIVGISLFAANISSSTLVGLAGDAYKTNTQVFNYEWLASVVLVFFAIFFLPFYLKSKVYTMPEFLERRYDQRSRYYFSFVTIVGNVMLDTAAGLYVGTVILKLLFPGLSTFAIVSILAVAAAAYTVPGGLNSVIQTEVIQAILLIFGSCLITYFAFTEIGGWNEMIAGLNEMGAAGTLPDNGAAYQPSNAEEVLSLVRPAGQTWGEFFLGTGGDGFMPWTGLLLGAPILGFYFWANNQFMVQRVLGAKDLNHGRWGALFAGLLKLPVLFIMVLPGTAAIIYVQQQGALPDGFDIANINYQLPGGGICEDLADCPNATYPMLLFQMLPTGILGLVLAGLLAAMMSSVSATFNSASTLITMDFANKLYPNLSSKQLVRVGQVSTLILVILACLWAPQIERYSSLWEYLQIVLSFIAPPVAAAFILGMFWERANGTGAFVSLLFGAAVSVAYLVMDGGGVENWFTEMHFLHRTFYLFVA